VRRLLLVRHAPTSATRRVAFPVDEPLDDRGRAAAATLAGALPHAGSVVTSPALRCRQTAAAAGLAACVEPAVAECDFGDWAGRTLGEVDIGAWMVDPDAAPHGGESLRAFAARIAAWLDGQAALGGAAAVITHAGVVKAAVVHALGAPLAAFWRVDVAPLSVTEIHAHDGRWTVTRVSAPPSGALA
jgi:broad specificity phosphatase PhoE